MKNRNTYHLSAKMIAFCLCLILTACCLAGCVKENGEGHTSSDKGLQKVILNEVAHSIFYSPLYVAIEEGYFKEEGLDVTLIIGFGADKTMTAVLTDEADIGFMGSESTLYTFAGGTDDYVINFAQLTQRAGNFLVAREPAADFTWDMLKGKTVLGGRAGERSGFCRFVPIMMFSQSLFRH